MIQHYVATALRQPSALMRHGIIRHNTICPADGAGAWCWPPPPSAGGRFGAGPPRRVRARLSAASAPHCGWRWPRAGWCGLLRRVAAQRSLLLRRNGAACGLVRLIAPYCGCDSPMIAGRRVAARHFQPDRGLLRPVESCGGVLRLFAIVASCSGILRPVAAICDSGPSGRRAAFSMHATERGSGACGRERESLS